MKFICEKNEITEAILNTQRAVTSKTSMATLSGILINAVKGNVVLTGYDLEIAITTKVEARVLEEGSVVLDAALLADIIKRVPTDTVEITVDNKSVTTIVSGNYEASITGIPGIEYPELPTVNDAKSITLSSSLLQSMISQTIFAVADDDRKPVYTGIKFEIEDDNLTLIAVDGYRLAIRREKIEKSQDMEFIVPKKALNEITKLMGEEEKDINIHIGFRHILFEIGEIIVISRILEGNFLDYKTSIPQGATTEVVVNTREMINSIDRLSLLIIERLKNPIRCKIADKRVELKCTTTRGKAQDSFDCDMTGENLELGFNYRYFIDALRASESDSVKIEFNGRINPIKILPMDGDNFLFLVLPIRLMEESE